MHNPDFLLLFYKKLKSDKSPFMCSALLSTLKLSSETILTFDPKSHNRLTTKRPIRPVPPVITTFFSKRFFYDVRNHYYAKQATQFIVS